MKRIIGLLAALIIMMVPSAANAGNLDTNSMGALSHHNIWVIDESSSAWTFPYGDWDKSSPYATFDNEVYYVNITTIPHTCKSNESCIHIGSTNNCKKRHGYYVTDSSRHLRKVVMNACGVTKNTYHNRLLKRHWECQVLGYALGVQRGSNRTSKSCMRTGTGALGVHPSSSDMLTISLAY